MKMKRIVSFVIAVMLAGLFGASANAQIFGASEAFKGKVIVGGNFNAGFVGNGVCVGIAPQVGYRLTRSLEVGVRLGYELDFYNDYYYGHFFYHYFTGAAYANLEIVRGVYIQVEDEELCSLVRGSGVNALNPSWYNSLFVGIGYRQFYNETSFAYVACFYNLSWDYGYYATTNPYNSPLLMRVGYCFAL